jgi:hypothetical protein
MTLRSLPRSLVAGRPQEWRRGLTIRPPPMSRSHPLWPGHQPQYADLTDDEIPLTESLADCMARTLPVVEQRVFQARALCGFLVRFGSVRFGLVVRAPVE